MRSSGVDETAAVHVPRLNQFLHLRLPYKTPMHLMKEWVTEVEEAHLKVTLSYVHKLG